MENETTEILEENVNGTEAVSDVNAIVRKRELNGLNLIISYIAKLYNRKASENNKLVERINILDKEIYNLEKAIESIERINKAT